MNECNHGHCCHHLSFIHSSDFSYWLVISQFYYVMNILPTDVNKLNFFLGYFNMFSNSSLVTFSWYYWRDLCFQLSSPDLKNNFKNQYQTKWLTMDIFLWCRQHWCACCFFFFSFYVEWCPIDSSHPDLILRADLTFPLKRPQIDHVFVDWVQEEAAIQRVMSLVILGDKLLQTSLCSRSEQIFMWQC